MLDKRELIENLAQISNGFHVAQLQLMKKRPDIQQHDARIAVFTKCYIVIDSIYICSIVRSYELSEPDWWDRYKDEDKIANRPPDEQLPELKKAFDSFTISAFFSLLFTAIESSFRAFHKAVYPQLKLPFGFSDVYESLLHGLGLAEYGNLLELANNIRNALVHNNGYHTKKSLCVRWKDLTVEFRKDEAVQFGDAWKAMFVISPGILELLIKVVNSAKIMEKSIIKDLSFEDDSP